MTSDIQFEVTKCTYIYQDEKNVCEKMTAMQC